MIECPRCGRLFPEVVGAPSQACPHCEHEFEASAALPRARSASPVDAFGALAQAAGLGVRDYPRLLLVFLPAFLVELVVGFAIEAYAAAAGLAEDVESLTTGQQMQLLGVALPLLILLYTVRLALWTFVAARVLDVSLGGRRLAAWKGLLGPAILMGFVLTLAFLAGALLLVVGFLVFLHWFAYAPAQLAAGAPTVGAAFDRSRRFAQEQRTYGFTALLVLVGLAVLVPYFMTDALGGTLGIVVPALVNWIGGPLVPLLAASFVALAKQGAPAAQAFPPAGAPARAASAKCPRCATLIPYEPAGAPVEVRCPSCGYRGKLL